jgi:hypothetical protein
MSHKCLITAAVSTMVVIGISAGELAPPPQLAESSEVAVRLPFTDPTPATEIYRAVGEAAGIEVIFDPRLNAPLISIEIDTSTTSEALDLVAAAAGDLWVPVAEDTVIVADDTPQKHREYEPLVVRSYVLEDGNVREADKLLRAIVNVRNIAVNEDLRTITIRETANKMPIIEHLIASVDHAPGEIDVRVELLRLSETSSDNPPPARFEADEYISWRRTGRAVVMADSTLGLLGSRHANLHLGAIQDLNLDLDLRLDGRVHPESRSVSLEVRAMLAPIGPETPTDGSDRPARGRIETSARIGSGSTLLLRVPASGPGGIAIAITPTIVRATEISPEQLAPVWVGTEMRIQASR